MPAYKAVLLDTYGTLWYLKKTSAQIWRELLPDLGADCSLEEILAAEQKEGEWLGKQVSVFETTGAPNSISSIRAFW